MTETTHPRQHEGRPLMAIEVRIPTILRPYTGGERAVDGRAPPSPS